MLEVCPIKQKSWQFVFSKIVQTITATGGRNCNRLAGSRNHHACSADRGRWSARGHKTTTTGAGAADAECVAVNNRGVLKNTLRPRVGKREKCSPRQCHGNDVRNAPGATWPSNVVLGRACARARAVGIRWRRGEFLLAAEKTVRRFSGCTSHRLNGDVLNNIRLHDPPPSQ